MSLPHYHPGDSRHMPFAPKPAILAKQLREMIVVDKSLLRDLKRNKPPGLRGRSNLFRYILEHWDALRAYGYGMKDGPTWQELTDRLSRHGQVNAKGGPLQRSAVRYVFLRVQAEVLAKETQRRTGVAVKPQVARAQPDWRPPIVERTPTLSTPPASPLSPFAPRPASKESDTSDPYSPERLVAGLREVINKHSGR